MDKKPFKTTVGEFLQYNWIGVILLGVLSFAVFYYPIQKINEFKDFEEIDFFLEVYDVKDDGVVEAIKNANPGVINNVEEYVVSPTSSTASKFYEAYGPTSDFLVLPESDLSDMKEYVSTAALPLGDSLLSSFLSVEEISSLEFFSYGGVKYGIKIYDPAEGSTYNAKFNFGNLFNFGKGTSPFYFLIGPSSNNFGLFGSGSVNDAGITTAALLAKRYLA